MGQRDRQGAGGQGAGQNRQGPRPRMLDVRKLEEFDFEKANAEFEELTKDVEDLKVTDAEKTVAAPETSGDASAEVTEAYNKTKVSSVSCLS